MEYGWPAAKKRKYSHAASSGARRKKPAGLRLHAQGSARRGAGIFSLIWCWTCSARRDYPGGCRPEELLRCRLSTPKRPAKSTRRSTASVPRLRPQQSTCPGRARRSITRAPTRLRTSRRPQSTARGHGEIGRSYPIPHAMNPCSSSVTNFGSARPLAASVHSCSKVSRCFAGAPGKAPSSRAAGANRPGPRMRLVRVPCPPQWGAIGNGPSEGASRVRRAGRAASVTRL